LLRFFRATIFPVQDLIGSSAGEEEEEEEEE
jgi:hypothetical protein